MRRASWKILAGLGAAVVLVYVAVAGLILSRSTPADATLPTLAVLNSAEPTSEPPFTESSLQAVPTDLALEVLPTDAPSIPATISQQTVFPTNAPAIPQPTTTTQAIAIVPTAQISVPTVIVTTALPAATTAPTFAVPTSIPAATAAPTNAVPTPTIDAAGLIPLANAADIGVGDLRVVSSTAPANSSMASLGGNVPPIAANQQWVLLEVLLICNSSTCSAPVNALSLQSSASSYPATPLAVESAFGGSAVNGQIWGHLAFVIPANEQPTFLRFQGGGQEIRFGLQ